ncbi:MAG TPA: magnesium transporter [Pirellulales bacterium]|jgi:magnesium transporter|nr:magnesium transporter [Pirellulales bacterium]
MNVQLAKLSMDDSILKHLGYDFVQIKEQQSVGQALASIRENPTIGHFIYFYVVDDNGHLVGVVPTRRLLLSSLETSIADILIRDVITIPETATVLEACELFTLHKLLAFPIVDGKRRLIGVVDVGLYTEGRAEFEEAERSEDLFQLIGVHLAESQHARPAAAFRSRFPWLICNIVGGIIAAFISGIFQAELERVVALALFVPVVLGLAESVSIQSVSLTLQWLHGRPPTLAGLWAKLRKEFLVGVMLGSVSAALVALVSIVWLHNYRVAVCLLLGIGGGMTVAALIGVAMPNLLRMLRRNPQVAAGPIALATADMITLLVYFTLARLVT